MKTDIQQLKLQIKALEKARIPLEEQLSKLRQEARTLKLRLAELEFGVRVGAIVLFRGVRHQITAIDVKWGDKPWLRGNPMKKDGTFGTAERHLYSNWEPTK